MTNKQTHKQEKNSQTNKKTNSKKQTRKQTAKRTDLVSGVWRHGEEPRQLLTEFDGQTILDVEDGLFPVGVASLRGWREMEISGGKHFVRI